MSEKTAIGWTDHTFNAWWGCMKVSPGCENCYALTFAKRTGHDIWGPPKTTPRRFFGEKHWQEPFKWNRDAEAAGIRRRVFSASMSDVFEDHPDVGPHRDRLFRTIEATPWLDWQLLTKRPENVWRMIPDRWRDDPPGNWWQGTSVEDQQRANERVPILLGLPAPILFLSMEPLLGGVDLTDIGGQRRQHDALTGEYQSSSEKKTTRTLSWVIVGGESGAGHRTMNLDWVTRIAEDCRRTRTPIYVKQDSGQYPGKQGRIPDELFLHQFPDPRTAGAVAAAGGEA